MKEIINVSIAGIAFKLDNEAFAALDNYLSKIRESYTGSEDGAEIISDIEARIAEIILSHQDASVNVQLPLIEEAIAQLGTPEDIAESDTEKKGKTDQQNEAGDERQGRNETAGISRRLYRNPDEARFAGVCSGLAAYFGTDAVVVRLIFAAPLVLLVFFAILGFGFLVRSMTGLMTTSFILYFLLWIVIPKARTPRQKLEMRGEKITKSRIEQTFREEFQNMPRNNTPSPRSDKNASILAELVSIIGRIMLFFAKAIVAIIGFSFIIAIVGIVVGVCYALVNGVQYAGGDLALVTPAVAVIVFGLIVMIPLGLAVYGILKALFGFHHSKTLISSMMVIWIITLAFGTVIFIKNFNSIVDNRGFIFHSDRTEFVQEKDDRQWTIEPITPLNLTKNTLVIEPMDSTARPEHTHSYHLSMRSCDTENPTPSVIVKTRYDGIEKDMEKGTTKKIDVHYAIRNDTLFVRPYFNDLKNNTHGETVEFNIYLPDSVKTVVNGGIDYNEYYDQNQ